MIPTFEGSTVSFSCPPGFVLTGPDSATCTGNGEWEPDPRGITCNNVSLEGQCTMLHKFIGNPMHAVAVTLCISLLY